MKRPRTPTPTQVTPEIHPAVMAHAAREIHAEHGHLRDIRVTPRAVTAKNHKKQLVVIADHVIADHVKRAEYTPDEVAEIVAGHDGAVPPAPFDAENEGEGEGEGQGDTNG